MHRRAASHIPLAVGRLSRLCLLPDKRGLSLRIGIPVVLILFPKSYFQRLVFPRTFRMIQQIISEIEFVVVAAITEV